VGLDPLVLRRAGVTKTSCSLVVARWLPKSVCCHRILTEFSARSGQRSNRTAFQKERARCPRSQEEPTARAIPSARRRREARVTANQFVTSA
jgi:hypothetical protein